MTVKQVSQTLPFVKQTDSPASKLTPLVEPVLLNQTGTFRPPAVRYCNYTISITGIQK